MLEDAVVCFLYLSLWVIQNTAILEDKILVFLSSLGLNDGFMRPPKGPNARNCSEKALQQGK